MHPKNLNCFINNLIQWAADCSPPPPNKAVLHTLTVSFFLSSQMYPRGDEWETVLEVAQPGVGSQIRGAENEQERWQHRSLSHPWVSLTLLQSWMKHHLFERKSFISWLMHLFSFQSHAHNESVARWILIYCSRPVLVGIVKTDCVISVQAHILYQP